MEYSLTSYDKYLRLTLLTLQEWGKSTVKNIKNKKSLFF
ncbi:Transcriptional regulator, HxlR family (fragment) [Capnocytophaga cynodegmi]|uniref:Transcriptional regulator, HxlR family n=1 Tax=Capnocytophaga cynodegmi TaxID=28189 RepID=A0A0B7HGJ3_9FLAO